jgi:anthranilate/para-aminobenzoate synthase component II
MPDEIHSLFDTILILDFGSQYSHLITRRCRELNVYCEMLPCTQKISELSWKPAGIILSGSPYSVYDSDAPHVDPAVFELGVPIMGICYGLQEIARKHGGEVGAHSHREYGHANVTIVKTGNKAADSLFDGIEVGDEGMQVSELYREYRRRLNGRYGCHTVISYNRYLPTSSSLPTPPHRHGPPSPTSPSQSLAFNSTQKSRTVQRVRRLLAVSSRTSVVSRADGQWSVRTVNKQ